MMFKTYDDLVKILREAMEAGVIDDFAECPGVPRIDIIPVGAENSVTDWIQIEVIR